MRPGQNKQRMRGRNNNTGRKGPNPLTRSFESNGPDVKIRGTAQHIGEKYLQLARDAQTSGDPVAAENYLQHAEHYFRLIAAAQLAQAQAAQGYQRSETEADEAEDDDDVGGLPDRFASPFERQAQAAAQTGQPSIHAAQPFVGGEAPRQDQPRDEQQPPRPEHYRQDSRPDYRGQGRGQDYRTQEGRSQDSRSQDSRSQDNRQQDMRGERPYNNERSYNNSSGGERQDRNGPRENRWQSRGDNRPQRSQEPRENRGPREPYQPREYAPREHTFRDNTPREYAPRDNAMRDTQDQRSLNAPQNPISAPPTPMDDVGLPAFITAPVRAPVVADAEASALQQAAAPAPQPRQAHARPGRPPKVAQPPVQAAVENAADAEEAPAKIRKTTVRRKRPVFEDGSDLLAAPAKDE